MRKHPRQRPEFACEARQVRLDVARIGARRDRREAELGEPAHLPCEEAFVVRDLKCQALVTLARGTVEMKSHELANSFPVKVRGFPGVGPRGLEERERADIFDHQQAIVQ